MTRRRIFNVPKAEEPKWPSDLISDKPPVTPRPSASVIVVRNNINWDVLMIRRSAEARFAPLAFVFPGGSVQEDDLQLATNYSFPPSETELSRLRLVSDGTNPLALMAAAVRELFEETGLLLAKNVKSHRMCSTKDAEAIRYMVSNGYPFGEALKLMGLLLALDKLIYFDRWITPELLSVRFDARFFLARLPSSQKRFHLSEEEASELLWIKPLDAVRLYNKGKLDLVFATLSILESLSQYKTSSGLIRATHRKRYVRTVKPRLRHSGINWQIVVEETVRHI
jgi:recombination protein RecT